MDAARTKKAGLERGPHWVAPLMVALIWGVNVPVMKAALVLIHPLAFNALRLTLSALALGVADRWERGRRPAPATPWLAVLGLGLLSSFFYQQLFLAGIARTSASHSGFLIASQPLWTALCALALRIEHLARRAWLGLGIAFAGTCLVAAEKSSAGATLAGNLLMLGAMVLWALGTVLSRPLLARLSATRLAFLFTSVALPAHWLFAWSHMGPLWTASLPAGAWAAIGYSGLLSTGIAYSLWNLSVRRLGPARTSAYTNLIPLVALAVAWVALGERPGLLQLLGGALVLAGIASWRSGAAR